MTVFIDSNIWMYALVDGDDLRHARAVDALRDHGARVVISTQVLAEVACNLLKKARLDEHGVRQRIGRMEAAAIVHTVGADTHCRASLLREREPCSYWDSLIVAAAIEAGCEALWSEDLQAGRVMDGRLAIVNPLATTRP